MSHNLFGTMRVIAAHSGLVLDVAGASTEVGAPLVQFPQHEQPNQVFEIERPIWGSSNPGVFVSIRAHHSGLVLDVAEASTENGAPLIQWERNFQPNQHFRLEPVADGLVRIIAKHSGLVLDVAGASMDAGTPIIQWTWHGGLHQLWRV
jgi:hypothetical protein